MDDRFLYDLRESPPADFEEELLERLNQAAPSVRAARRRGWALPRPAWLAASGLTVLVVGLSFPSVRSLAQQFLDLFRVQRFVAISIDPARLEQLARLKDGSFDLKSLLSRNTEVIKEPGQMQVVANSAEAGRLAGIEVRLPTALPSDLVQDQIRVAGEGMARFTADTVFLQSLMDALEITDVLVPQELNRATVTVRLPPRVFISYNRSGISNVMLMQAASPEITLPQGVHLPEIVEIVLRILGMNLDEARQFAYSVDWRGTLLVPVPAQEASFREVDLGRAKGLLIEPRNHSVPPGEHGRPEHPKVLMWSDDSKVYCLSGTIRSTELVLMASSLQ